MRKRKKIVVVEDNPNILELIKIALEMAGYEVVAERTGIRCSNLSEPLPDLFLLDIFLEEEDGRVLAWQLKRREQTQHIPIILLSAQLDRTSALKESNANDFLSKPFHLDELLKKVRQYT